MPTIDLNTLASMLREQAKDGSKIVLDKSIFADEVRARMQAAFATDSDLMIGVTEIPAPTADGELIISAAKAAVFKQTDLPVTLIFTTPNGGALQAVIRFELSSSWKFSNSFKGLDVFPFKELETSNAHFVYSTVERRAFAWPGERATTIELAQGLNFFSKVTFTKLSTLLKLLKPVIGETSLSLPMGGTFAPGNGDQLPLGKLRAPLLAGKELTVGVKPFELRLGDLAIAVQLGKTTDEFPAPEIALLLEARFQQKLNVTIAIPDGDGTLEVTTKPLPNYASIDALIGSLPGGSIFTDFITHLPGELTGVFTNVTLDNFALRVSPEPAAVSYVGLSITTAKPWTIIPRHLVLEGLRLDIDTIQPADLNWSRVRIEAAASFLKDFEIFPGKFDFLVELQKETSWKVSTISGAYHGSVNLGTIASKLVGGSPVPSFLSGIQFSDFGVTVEKDGEKFNYTLYGSAEASFPILDHQFSASLTVVVKNTASGHEGKLAGGFVIGDQKFSFSLKLGESTSAIEATWENEEQPLGFGDLASAFGWDSMPQLPEGLDLRLKSATITYDSQKTIVLKAHSVNYGEIVFASFLRNNKPVYFFAVDVPLGLKFSELPLVGASLPTDKPVGVDKLQIIAGSEKFAETQITELNKITGIELMPKSLDKGLTLAAKLELNGAHDVILPLTDRPQTVRAQLPSAPAALTDGTYQADAKWFEIKKTFGPVNFEKVGVQYQSATLRFLLNAGLSAAGLTLSVEGLSIGSSLKEFKPEFGLRGLGIDYRNDAVEIGGMFLRTITAGKADSYDGAAVIKTRQFAVAALGSYTTLDGAPSLFIYAFLDYPLGGPAFFFVTGLAAGFGYNRRLIAPSVENVAEFPLVKQAAKKESKPKDVLAALRSLQSHVPPNVGSIFLAAGVRFNSFKLIDSFALLTMEFGNNLAINLIGLSKAVIPTPDGSTVTPLAQVEIAWKATFNPDDGCLAIDARLTANSFILSRDCRLSGGYAFYSWFTGPHAGDFVQTLGGYHPKFEVPAHYPKVPRLAFDWRVSNSLTIQGDAYYALTGSALMAGGHLEVLFRDGNLRAWLKLGADFLIAWKPYHYDASIYVNVGASYTFDINLLFTSVRVTLSVDVGAQLHLWGPDFSGTARIDLSVISFTIAFGAGASQAPEPLKEWSTFQQSFLPATNNVCSISVKDGLVRNLEAKAGSAERWVINPKQFALVIDSAIPIKSTPSLGGKLDALANVEFGIAPMAKTKEQFEISNLTIALTKNNGKVTSKLKYSLIKKLVPTGLWGETANPALHGKKFLDQVATGIEITPAEPPQAGETKQIPIESFKYLETPFPHASKWQPGSKFNLENKGVADRRKKIADSVGSNKGRDALLAEVGLAFNITMGKNVADDFVTAPQIGTLELCQPQ